MFKIISKKKYEKLKGAAARMQERFDAAYDVEHKKRVVAEERACSAEEMCKIMKVSSRKDAAALDKYKTLYADELYKRVQLSEKVNGLEERAVRAEDDYAELLNSLQERADVTRKRTVSRIMRVLVQGVPQEGGTFCKDLDVIIDYITKEFIVHRQTRRERGVEK